MNFINFMDIHTPPKQFKVDKLGDEKYEWRQQLYYGGSLSVYQVHGSFFSLMKCANAT